MYGIKQKSCETKVTEQNIAEHTNGSRQTATAFSDQNYTIAPYATRLLQHQNGTCIWRKPEECKAQTNAKSRHSVSQCVNERKHQQPACMGAKGEEKRMNNNRAQIIPQHSIGPGNANPHKMQIREKERKSADRRHAIEDEEEQ